jgi:hypothetical protein
VATAIDPDARANDGTGCADVDGAAAAGASVGEDGTPGAGGGWFIGSTPTSTPLRLPIAEGGAWLLAWVDALGVPRRRRGSGARAHPPLAGPHAPPVAARARHAAPQSGAARCRTPQNVHADAVVASWFTEHPDQPDPLIHGRRHEQVLQRTPVISRRIIGLSPTTINPTTIATAPRMPKYGASCCGL